MKTIKRNKFILSQKKQQMRNIFKRLDNVELIVQGLLENMLKTRILENDISD